MSNGTTIIQTPRLAARLVSHKITAEHLKLGAALYIRQSSGAQLRNHRESTARQYGLKDHLIAFGWPDDRVVVIDEDLGISGTGTAARPGFRRLLKLVTDQEIGIVLGLEMSRLARNSRDWHDLFEVCAIFHTLIADEDGVFDPQDPNDRLVLGLKGIIAEMELHTMKVRLEGARLKKAERGELFHDVPVGYVLDERRLPQFDLDESARHVMKMFFDLFESIGSSHGLFCHLVEHNIRLPFRANRRQPSGPIDWRLPSLTGVYEILKHPLYAGAYGYGRRHRYRNNRGKRAGRKYLAPDQWKVLIKDRHPAYITWAQYESNQRRLQENDSVGDRSGPVRSGSALLAGIVWCARCGRRLSPKYPQNGHASYSCVRHHTVAHAEPCHSSIRCKTLDEFVTSKVLEVLSPAGLDLSLRVIEDEQARREQLDSLSAQRVDQARYAVDLAERRFKHVDPANRLVAGRLEGEWEAALAELQLVLRELDQLRIRQPVKLSDTEREKLRRTCEDVASLWSKGATIEERKQIVRLLLRRVEVEVHNNTERVSIRLNWSGGFESSYVITRAVMQFCQLETYEQLIDRVLQLTLAGKRSPEVASILEQEGFRSPRRNTPISSMMVKKLLVEQPRCREELTNPSLEPNHRRSDDLAKELGIPEEQVKYWVMRGWVTATRRPFGRVWVICADDQEVARLKRLHCSQTGQDRRVSPEKPRTRAAIRRKSAEK